MISEKTRTVVIAVVTTVWAANFVAGVVIPKYEPSESINGIFMAIVGGLFALGAARGGNGGGTGGQQPPQPPPPPQQPEQPAQPTQPPPPPATPPPPPTIEANKGP